MLHYGVFNVFYTLPMELTKKEHIINVDRTKKQLSRRMAGWVNVYTFTVCLFAYMLNETLHPATFKKVGVCRRTTKCLAVKKKNSEMKNDNKQKKNNKYEQIHFRISQEDKEIISENARKCNLTVGEYLRQVGCGYTPKNNEHLERIHDLIIVNSDLGRLGGLLKLWLTDQLKVSYYYRKGIVRLLHEIEYNRLQLEEIMEKILKM